MFNISLSTLKKLTPKKTETKAIHLPLRKHFKKTQAVKDTRNDCEVCRGTSAINIPPQRPIFGTKYVPDIIQADMTTDNTDGTLSRAGTSITSVYTSTGSGIGKPIYLIWLALVTGECDIIYFKKKHSFSPSFALLPARTTVYEYDAYRRPPRGAAFESSNLQQYQSSISKRAHSHNTKRCLPACLRFRTALQEIALNNTNGRPISVPPLVVTLCWRGVEL